MRKQREYARDVRERSVAEPFPCLHRTRRGKSYHCPEFDRLVVDFMGVYLVFRTAEFLRFQARFASLAACQVSRARFARGERIQVRGDVGNRILTLGLSEVTDLSELLEITAKRILTSSALAEKIHVSQ